MQAAFGETQAMCCYGCKNRLHIVWETTDVLYHAMVLLAFYGLTMDDVLQELRRREGISGIDEKNSRTAK